MKNNLEPKAHSCTEASPVGVLASTRIGAIVPDRIARQASATPNAAAVVCGGQTLTYAQLVSQSGRLANYLRSQGVETGQVIGLYLDRTPAMVVAALAVMNAGGAYLPLPPDSPAERLEFMLRDAGVAFVVTDSASTQRLPKNGHRVIALDVVETQVAGQSEKTPDLGLDESSLAYVIFTSGSTGQPKGVEILHRGLSNLVEWHLQAFSVTAADRASHLAALGFDAAVWELWPYLAAGASVHLGPERVRQDPQALRDWLVAERISIAFVATPLAERLMLLPWPRETALRILLTGADTLRHRPSANLPFTLVNNYGPTECTVVATSGTVHPVEMCNRVPSIGQAIHNTRLHVFDENMRAVPAGSVGELYIGGAGVARGYRNHPELTAQRFVTNPSSSDPAERLYRTGDMVRMQPEGEVEFLGRLDEQIKIRGYRIEPGEIIKVLDEYPGIQACTVIAREQQPGEKTLVAYLVTSPETNITAADLRDYVSKQLPAYMVPNAFVRLSALPVTANGKVDRDALPAPETSATLPDHEFVAPRTLVEQRLAGILAQLLNVKSVGVHDNFFLLGGHSLLGTQLLTRINQSFGVDLSLLSLFDHPTLAGMSEEIEKLILAKLEAQQPSLLSAQPGGAN